MTEGEDGYPELLPNRVIAAGRAVMVEMMDEMHVRGVKTASQMTRINQALKEGRLVMPE